MMPTMRLSRTVVIVSAVLLVAGTGGEALGAGRNVSTSVPAHGAAADHFRSHVTDAAAMSAAMLAARSPRSAAQHLMATELSAVEPDAPAASSTEFESDCDIDEGGGSTTGIGTHVGTTKPATAPTEHP
jgi:hypothetical protein